MNAESVAAPVERAPEYRVQPSLPEGSMRYRLSDDALTIDWAKTGKSRSVSLAKVRHIRLTCIQGQGLCTITIEGEKKVVISSRHFRGFGNWVEQSAQYGDFVKALHERVARVSPECRYLGGSGLMFALGVLLVVMVVGASVMMRVAAAMGKSVPLDLSLKVLFGAVIGVPLMLQGRPKAYFPNALPVKHMPLR